MKGREKRNIATVPVPKLQLAMEMEFLEKVIKEEEKKGATKQETSLIWMEVASRKEQYRSLTGAALEPHAEVARNEKVSLQKVFLALRGYTWQRNGGWTGQSKTLFRPEIEPFLVPASLFEGLSIFALHALDTGKVIAAHVRSFDLAGNGCDGMIPQEITNFENCQFLKMNMNIIRGQLPRSMYNLASLEELNLSCNLLSGMNTSICFQLQSHNNTIVKGQLDPESFSHFKKIQVLNLSFNQFEGPIPDVFDHMKNLKTLDLAGNMLTGGLPDTMSCCVALEFLKLQSNHLSGQIPQWMKMLKSLKEVNLSKNKFIGGQNNFNDCSKLERLILNENLLRGNIEPSVSSLQCLKMLYLHNNKVEGRIPKELFRLTTLEHLNLSNNYLEGTLPTNLGDLTNLISLVCSGNSITGPVPMSVTKLVEADNLRDFHIFKPFPSELFESARIFKKEEFRKLYLVGPNLGIDTIVWNNKAVYGVDIETLEELEEKYQKDDHHDLLDFRKIKIHNDDTKKQVKINMPDNV